MEKQSKQSTAQASQEQAPSEPEHPKPTLKSNLILTIKVFATAGLVLLLLWILDKGTG
jgi:cell division septal protein FtsQ